MTRGVLADVGPLYAAIDPTDQFYGRANEELARLTRDRQPISLLSTTLVEGHGLILFRIGTRAATLWVDQILEAAILVTPDPDDFLAAAALLRRFPDQRITLADGVVAVVSPRLGLPVWTEDHHVDTKRALIWRLACPFRSVRMPGPRAPPVPRRPGPLPTVPADRPVARGLTPRSVTVETWTRRSSVVATRSRHNRRLWALTLVGRRRTAPSAFFNPTRAAR